MKNSPVYPNYEISDYGGYQFDPQLDFSQFLEEARQHAREMNLQSSLAQSDKDGKREVREEKKRRKSWKSYLVKWWKAEKKSKPNMKEEDKSQTVNSRKGHVSGPINGSEREGDTRLRRQTSGPLANLFNRSKRVENEVPYLCLNQLDRSDSHGRKAYGPVYLVT